MNRFIIHFTSLVLLVVLSASCKKVYDYAHDNPGEDYSGCQVQKITFNESGVTGTFKYNKDGNPESVKYSETNSERPNFIFRYDNQKRLSESIEYYNNGAVEKWSRYYYNAAGLIISDSVYRSVHLVNGVPVKDEGATPEVNSYVYDSEKRIVGINVQFFEFPGQEGDVLEYFYNAGGNLEGSAYDNKMNIHRTSKVFMFIDRDYSLNNPLGPTAYNSSYLPATFGPSGISSLLRTSLNNAAVTYKCK